MDQEETLKRTTIGVDALRGVLKSQYHAALAMLRDAIDLCPSDAWYGDGHGNAPWQIAYHTLFFAHLYMQPSVGDFRPWEQHQSGAQHPDGIAGRPPDPGSTLPLLPNPYSRDKALE